MEGKKKLHPNISFKNVQLEQDGIPAMDKYMNGTKEEKSQTLREKWKDPLYRRNVIYSMFMSASFASLGMYLGQHGPTFLDMQLITNTDLEEASAFFTGGNAGHLAGCIITGLIYSKVNSSLLQFLVTLGMGLTNMALPYCVQPQIMIAVRFVSAAFGGGIANGLNTGHLALWGSEGNGLLQFSHFVFSVGGMLSPMFAEPFLMEKTSNSIQAKANITTTTDDAVRLEPNTTGSTSTIALPTAESRVKYVFFITGIFAIITAIPFLIIFIKGEKKRKESVAAAGQQTIAQRNIPTMLMVAMVTGLCVFEMLYVSVETTHFNFLMTFLVEKYGVSKSKGAVVTAIGWGSFAAARFLMIFMTRKFSSLQLLVMLSVLLTASQCATAVVAHLGLVNPLIVFSAISAFAMSGIFPAGLSWAERDLFHVTGIFTSCVVVSSSLGSMVNPLFLGFLMERHSKMWFCFLLLAETLVMGVTLTGLLAVSRLFVDRKYGPWEALSPLNMTTDINVGGGTKEEEEEEERQVVEDTDAQTKLCVDNY